MAEKNTPVSASAPDIREAVCIHTNKIFDSCKDKDCVEDLRVYLTNSSQDVVEGAFSVRPRTATLLYADVRVDEINFNHGCYTVDVTYFYRVSGDTFPGERPVTGLAIFEKRVILYGSDGNAKVFTSNGDKRTYRGRNLPVAVVEAVDPLPLSMRIVDADCHYDHDCDYREIPEFICEFFDDELITDRTRKRLFVTLGQFSIIRLERDTQLLIPVYDYCVPDKECNGNEEDPCSLFGAVPFPVDDFFPPSGKRGKCAGGCGPDIL